MNEQNGRSAVLGLQHLLAMYAGAVAVPLLIGTGLGFNEAQMTYLISIDIFMCGVATLLQLTVTRFFGIGLPVVLGCAIQAVSPLILIGTKSGIGAIYGAIIASGIFVVLISGVFSKIKVLFPPLGTGTVRSFLWRTRQFTLRFCHDCINYWYSDFCQRISSFDCCFDRFDRRNFASNCLRVS